MSMAGVIPRTRPSIATKIRGEDEERSSEEREREAKDKDLIKDRSPLADMLYLRCEWYDGPDEVGADGQGWMV